MEQQIDDDEEEKIMVEKIFEAVIMLEKDPNALEKIAKDFDWLEDEQKEDIRMELERHTNLDDPPSFSFLTLARFYKKGDEALKYFQRAYQIDKSPAAAYGISLWYYNNISDPRVEEIRKKEDFFLKEAADGGFVLAMYDWACRLVEAVKTNKEDKKNKEIIKKAISYLEKAVEKGDSRAMYELYSIYKCGEIVYSDPNLADRYWCMAYDAKNKDAEEDYLLSCAAYEHPY